MYSVYQRNYAPFEWLLWRETVTLIVSVFTHLHNVKLQLRVLLIYGRQVVADLWQRKGKTSDCFQKAFHCSPVMSKSISYPVLTILCQFQENPPIFKDNLLKKGLLFREFWDQKLPIWAAHTRTLNMLCTPPPPPRDSSHLEEIAFYSLFCARSNL